MRNPPCLQLITRFSQLNIIEWPVAHVWSNIVTPCLFYLSVTTFDSLPPLIPTIVVEANLNFKVIISRDQRS